MLEEGRQQQDVVKNDFHSSFTAGFSCGKELVDKGRAVY